MQIQNTQLKKSETKPNKIIISWGNFVSRKQICCVHSKFAVRNHRFVFQILLFSTPICFFKRSICFWKKINLLQIYSKSVKQIGCFRKQIGFNKSVISRKQIGDFSKNKSVVSGCLNILKRPICFSIYYSKNKFAPKKNKFVFLI